MTVLNCVVGIIETLLIIKFLNWNLALNIGPMTRIGITEALHLSVVILFDKGQQAREY